MAPSKKKNTKTESDADVNSVSEDGSGDSQEDGAKTKKKPKLIVLIIGGILALLIIGGGITAALLLAPHPKTQTPAKPPKHKSESKEGGKKGPSFVTDGPNDTKFFTLPDLTANIQTADGRPAYIKIKLSLEIKDESAIDSLQTNLPRITDMIQAFLRELTPEDISGSQGDYQLRLEIQKRINLLIAPDKINAVLIQELLIT